MSTEKPKDSKCYYGNSYYLRVSKKGLMNEFHHCPNEPPLDMPRLTDRPANARSEKKAKNTGKDNPAEPVIPIRKPLDFYSYFTGSNEVEEKPTPKPYEPKSFFSHFSFNDIERTKSCQSLANYNKALQQKFKEPQPDVYESAKASIEKPIRVKIDKPKVSFLQRYRSKCEIKNLTGLQLFSIVKFRSPYELHINVDKISLKEWPLFCDTLKTDKTLKQIYISSYKSYLHVNHDISSEQLCKSVKLNTGLLNTKYGLETLLHALGLTLIRNSNLQLVELSGLYLKNMYLSYVTEAFPFSSINRLSLRNCPIEDKGCLTLCNALKQQAHLKHLELNKCSLTAKSGIYISEFLKSKYIHYSTKFWENNLRNTVIEPKDISGILKLTLNNNPQLGDDGALPILTCLMDNECIKSIEMKDCGLTDYLEEDILLMITRNTSLIVADFRDNSVGKACLDVVAGILKERTPEKPPYRWYPALKLSTCETLSWKSSNPNRSTYLHLPNPSPSKCSSKSSVRKETVSRSSSTTVIYRRESDRLSNAARHSLSRHSTVSLVSRAKSLCGESVRALHNTTPKSSASTKTHESAALSGVNITLSRKLGTVNLLDSQSNLDNDDEDSEHSTKDESLNNSEEEIPITCDIITQLLDAMIDLENGTEFIEDNTSQSVNLEPITQNETEDPDGKSDD